MIPLIVFIAFVAIGAPLLAAAGGRRAMVIVSGLVGLPFLVALTYGVVAVFGETPCPDGRLYGHGCGPAGPIAGLMLWCGAIGLVLLGIGVALALRRLRSGAGG